MAVALSLLAISALALAAWLEWRSRRRVRRAVHEISAEAVRYLMTRQDGER